MKLNCTVTCDDCGASQTCPYHEERDVNYAEAEPDPKGWEGGEPPEDGKPCEHEDYTISDVETEEPPEDY